MPDTPATHQRVAWTDPAAVFAGIANSHAFWLDGGVDATGGWSWVGVGEPDDRPDVSFASLSRTGRVPASPAGPFLGGWVGWESYDAAALLAGAPARVDATAPASAWMRVTRLVAFDHGRRESLSAVVGDVNGAIDSGEVHKYHSRDAGATAVAAARVMEREKQQQQQQHRTRRK